MWEWSLIFWNSTLLWLTHTVFPPISASSSFIIKVSAILKNSFASFLCVGYFDVTNESMVNPLLLIKFAISFKSVQVNKDTTITSTIFTVESPAKEHIICYSQKCGVNVTKYWWPSSLLLKNCLLFRSCTCIRLTSD